MEGVFGEEVKNYNVGTFKEAMEAVQDNRADYGVLPIENSSTGIVTEVYDLLDNHDNYIVGEYVVKIEPVSYTHLPTAKALFALS